MHAWGKPALLYMLILILITTFYLKLTYQEYGNHLLSRARRQVDMGVQCLFEYVCTIRLQPRIPVDSIYIAS